MVGVRYAPGSHWFFALWGCFIFGGLRVHRGWVKIHRKITEWEWFNDANVFRLFVYCLVTANHEDKKWKGIEVKRGSFITSFNRLSRDLELSVKQIRTALNKLVESENVAHKGASKYSIITVLNYDSYQENESTKGQAGGHTKGKQRANKGQQLKNYKALEAHKEEYTYNSFYDSELKESENDENYETFIRFIFGNNELGEPLKNVLKLKQVTYEQFKGLWNKKLENNISLSQYLVQMENYKPLTKNNQYVSRTLHNWINRDLKK